MWDARSQSLLSDSEAAWDIALNYPRRFVILRRLIGKSYR